MSFVSLEFCLLFGGTLIVLLAWRSRPAHKLILLLASCIFYAYWDWRFLSLLVIVTVADYLISVRIHALGDGPARRNWLIASLCINLAILGYFKYFNFFVESLNLILAPLGWPLRELSIILPVGISFYIFETISYVVDVYRRTAEPAETLLDYAVFVTFFPRLVAGPIMRAAQFLPQLYRGLQFSHQNLLAGAQFFAQGLLKKVVVADSLALMVDEVYRTPDLYSSPTVILAVLAYSIQIYFDFSGYSDMACGVAKVLGFDLAVNFDLPYVARSITEFWGRWHISLSSWLRDYLYIPLGGNRAGRLRTYVNLMLTMLLGGLWHGASWNFVLWGGLHGAYLVVERLLRERAPRGSTSSAGGPAAGTWLRALAVFLIVSVTWIFFRSPSLEVTAAIFSKILFIDPASVSWLYTPAVAYVPIVFLGGLALQAYKDRTGRVVLSAPVRTAFVVFQYLLALLFFTRNISPFIYFQF